MADATSNSNPAPTAASNASNYESRSTTVELEVSSLSPGIRYPHVTIEYCTQCKWMLRAAYFAQELLSTFSSSPIAAPAPSPSTSTTTTTTTQPPPQQQTFTLPSITLVPSTGGTFIVTLYTTSPSTVAANPQTIILTTTTLWNRKLDGGFPETKELKRRLRDWVDPGRGLGHVDREYGKKGGEGKKEVGKKEEEDGKEVKQVKEEKGETCMDCL